MAHIYKQLKFHVLAELSMKKVLYYNLGACQKELKLVWAAIQTGRFKISEKETRESIERKWHYVNVSVLIKF